MRVEIRTTPEDKARWQALAESRGVSLSDLVRGLLDVQRLRRPRPRQAPPLVEPALLRELARLGNNLNQLARAANRQEPVAATAILLRLIEIDRELAAIRRAHERPPGETAAEESPADGSATAAAASVPPEDTGRPDPAAPSVNRRRPWKR